MADTTTRPGQIDGVKLGLTTYLNNDSSKRAGIDQTLDTDSLTSVVVIETTIATSTTVTFTPANVFGSAGNFSFVALIPMDSSASTSMQVEINNTGNLNTATRAVVYGGDASTSQVEVKNNDGSNTLALVAIFGR